MVFADTTISDETSRLCATGCNNRRLDRLHSRVARASAADFPQTPRGRGAAPAAATPAPAAAAAAQAEGGGVRTTVQGLPLVKPPYGVLSAINLDKGELMWQVPHGDTPDAIRNNQALRGMNIPKTGQGGSVGLLVTKTLVVLGDSQVTTTPEHPRGAM